MEEIEIVAVTDRDGDAVSFETTSDGENAAVFLNTGLVSRDAGGVYLTDTDVDKVRDALKPYGARAQLAGVPQVTFREPAKLSEGMKARVTGDSAGLGHPIAAGTTVTLDMVDSDGDWLCGTEDGVTWWVGPRDLEPLTAPAISEYARWDAAVTKRLFVSASDGPTFELNPLRVQALEKAAELAGRNVFGGVSGQTVLDFAEFLLGEDEGALPLGFDEVHL